MSADTGNGEGSENYSAVPAQEEVSSTASQERSTAFGTITTSLKTSFKEAKADTHTWAKEVHDECFGCMRTFEVFEVADFIKENWRRFVFNPYLPAFHQPGWLFDYVFGPHNATQLGNFVIDVWAGITVALTLIPQALSYASLANLPAINGLYTAILPSAVYTFLGSSLQLAVGPVALVSLMQAELINKYGITPASEESVDFAAECAVAVGTILLCMSVLNLGNLIRFISHPVMSAFTTAAAMIIGQNQLKSAFGFVVSVPQTGQPGYEWNYQVLQWYKDNWNLNDASTQYHDVKNFYAMRICLGLFFPMALFVVIKNNVKATPERKKTWSFTAFTIFVNVLPFVAIIIGAHLAWRVKHDDHYHDPHYKHSFYAKKLSVVGIVKPGLDVLRTPVFKWSFGKLLGDVFPTALVLFMESWSVAQRIATQNNQLHLLNASQELWAVGSANILASICSAYPVAGSFSRSSLNQAAGAKTPMSKVTTMVTVVITLRFLTRAFEYIPNAALAAVIWVAIFNLFAIGDLWHAWKHSKKDFFIMVVTLVSVFVTDTGVGLAVGLAVSVLVLLWESAFSDENSILTLRTHADHERGVVKELVLRQDVNFLTAGRFIDAVTNVMISKRDDDDAVPQDLPWNLRAKLRIQRALDKYLRPDLTKGVDRVPHAVVIDFAQVRIVDLTALEAIHDCAFLARSKKATFTVTNTTPAIAKSLAKFGFINDRVHPAAQLDLQQRVLAQCSELVPLRSAAVAGEKAVESASEASSEEGVELLDAAVVESNGNDNCV